MPQADPKSSSGQEQQQTAQTVPNPSPYPQHFEEDTIDLYELWITLWNRKWLVIAVTVVAAMGSIVYAQQLQRVYKAEALLLPPKAKYFMSINVSGITETNILDTGIKLDSEFKSEQVFKEFKQNLKSRSIQKKFIQRYGLMELLAADRNPETRDEDIYERFAAMFELGVSNGFTYLSIELYDAELATQWVNDFIEFVDKETVAMLIVNLQNLIENQSKRIEYSIGSKRQMAKQRREDQIVRYLEAAEIAKNLGIRRRVDATNIIQNTQMNVDIATATTPLYYLGYEALMTEIGILRNRKSDDPFIAGLRDLQEMLAMLNAIEIDQEKMRAVNIDQSAFPTSGYIKPNRRLTVSIATVVGLFSGIFLAFCIEFVQNQRKKHSV